MKFSEREKRRLLDTYGPWALVTGATSGIGKEMAMLLAEAGFSLVLVGRQQQSLDEIQENCRQLSKKELITVKTDLSETKGVEEVQKVCQGLPIHLIVLSAGFGTSGLLPHIPLEEEVNMLRVNIEALFVLTHHFSQDFMGKQKGGIILMSSMVAFQGTPYASNYAATKAYVQSLAEGLGEELKPYGVDVLAAAPGPVESGFGKRAHMTMGKALSPSDVALPILLALGRKRTVLPGWLTKVLVCSLATLPRWGKVKVMGLVMGGMAQK